MCQYAALPVVKWFSSSDQSDPSIGLTCTKIDRHVAGVDWRTWAGWLKLAQYLGE